MLRKPAEHGAGRRLAVPLIILTIAAVVASLSWLGPAGAVRLAERIDDSVSSVVTGEFPAFDRERTVVRDVTLSGDSRLSITPPFPSRLTFSIDVPVSGVLELATAMVVMQQVTRARVRFTVSVREEGVTAVVFEEILTLTEANRFRDTRIDLSSWSGRTIELVLEAMPVPANRQALWADRVQTVWGDPVVRRAGPASIAADAVERWLEEYQTLGIQSQERVDLRAFGINLLLAGVTAWFIAWCYQAFALGPARDSGFAKELIMFTLITTLLIAVVHSSVALSLGFLGALSVVRFRSAIQDSENILCLLLCIAVALALGTNQRVLALVAVVPVFLAVLLRPREEASPRRFLVEARGRVRDGSAMSVLDNLDDVADTIIVESLSFEGDEVDLRASLKLRAEGNAASLVKELSRRLPSFRLSFSAVDEGP